MYTTRRSVVTGGTARRGEAKRNDAARARGEFPRVEAKFDFAEGARPASSCTTDWPLSSHERALVRCSSRELFFFFADIFSHFLPLLSVKTDRSGSRSRYLQYRLRVWYFRLLVHQWFVSSLVFFNISSLKRCYCE